MPEEFFIPDLLLMLQVDRAHTAVQLSEAAEELCRLRQYTPAIAVAENASRMVRTDPWLLGSTLLYLSYARMCSDLPEQVRQALRDCDRAIRALGLSTYNYALAHLIRGQMDLHIYGVAGRASALHYFQRASDVLDKLRNEETQYNRGERARRCTELKDRADHQISHLKQKLTAPTEVKVPPKQRAPQPPAIEPEPIEPIPQEELIGVPLDDRLIMQRLIWPPAEPALVIDMPPGTFGLMPDFLGIRQLSVKDRVYDVKPLAGREPVQLRPRQKYWIVPLENAPRGELALVREQVRPDQAEQFVAVSEPTEPRVWIDKVEATEDFTHLYILGAEREWIMHDLSPEHLDLNAPRIIGIVEAILVPVDDQPAPPAA
ncbi:MAG TPA: hypothetical protein VMP08_11515 [Anaerolineae bacterium]|nr:hypothetical protein [Anaerolineae bacterium]